MKQSERLHNTYKLLDSGDFSKLEQIGSYKVIRPSQNSPYKKSNPKLWNSPDIEYTKNETGSGKWKYNKKVDESFKIKICDFEIQIKLTPFGHIGVFPEQEANWNLIKRIGHKKPGLEVLNMFAYSGLSTLAVLSSGMSVCHLDSSKGMVEWARENAILSNLSGKKVRWIVDDVMKFVKRETKRNKRYQGFILDPPSFGRGNKGEVWKIEKNLLPLLELLMELCKGKPEFIILSCHTTGYSTLTLERILKSIVYSDDGFFSSKELFIPEESGHKLPSGFSAYYLSSELKSIFD